LFADFLSGFWPASIVDRSIELFELIPFQTAAAATTIRIIILIACHVKKYVKTLFIAIYELCVQADKPKRN